MAKSLSRDQAIELGESLYYTGKPCKRGHLAQRRVSNYICVECAKTVYQVADRDSYRKGNTFLRQFNARKQHAIRSGIPFTIAFEEIEQPTHCPVFGSELNYNWSGLHRRDANKATIDKVLPDLGYVPGNVRVISWRANKLKADMNIEELNMIITYIKEHTNDKTV